MGFLDDLDVYKRYVEEGKAGTISLPPYEKNDNGEIIMYIGEHFCRAPECPRKRHFYDDTGNLRKHATLHGLVVAKPARAGCANMARKMEVIAWFKSLYSPDSASAPVSEPKSKPKSKPRPKPQPKTEPARPPAEPQYPAEYRVRLNAQGEISVEPAPSKRQAESSLESWRRRPAPNAGVYKNLNSEEEPDIKPIRSFSPEYIDNPIQVQNPQSLNMPALLEDPSTRNPPPNAHVTAAPTLTVRHTTLPKDNDAPITLYPITGGAQSLPQDLVRFLHQEFSAEILRGGTYPMEEPLPLQQFADYWFGTFAVLAIMDDVNGGEGLAEGRDWESACLGTFYIKPNYPGRCSHICNAGFITTSAARGKGVGYAMGEAYLDFAPRLGYTYSVFNLVFANNPASIRIWERLGFSVIGRVPKAARLENSKELVDALIFGRDLGN